MYWSILYIVTRKAIKKVHILVHKNTCVFFVYTHKEKFDSSITETCLKEKIFFYINKIQRVNLD